MCTSRALDAPLLARSPNVIIDVSLYWSKKQCEVRSSCSSNGTVVLLRCRNTSREITWNVLALIDLTICIIGMPSRMYTVDGLKSWHRKLRNNVALFLNYGWRNTCSFSQAVILVCECAWNCWQFIAQTAQMILQIDLLCVRVAAQKGLCQRLH